MASQRNDGRGQDGNDRGKRGMAEHPGKTIKEIDRQPAISDGKLSNESSKGSNDKPDDPIQQFQRQARIKQGRNSKDQKRNHAQKEPIL